MAQESPFLSLPQELRDLVYEYVSLDSGAHLRPSGKGQPISSSSLLLVSRRVSEEYKDVLRSTAPAVTAMVHDFDFTHVVQFIDELLEREAQHASNEVTLSFRTPKSLRKLELVLSLTRESLRTLDKLKDWLDRISSQPRDHYSTAFTTEYSGFEPAKSTSSDSTVAPITLMQMIDVVHWDWYLQTPNGTLKEEIGKVLDCLGVIEMRINRMRTNSLPSGPRLGGLEVF